MAQTLSQIKKFERKEMIVFTLICLVVLAVCVTTICIEMNTKKAGTTSWFLDKLVELATTFCINIALSISLLLALKTFFTMLKTIGMRSENINILKAMLIVLAFSFFCRAVLLSCTIVVVEMIPPLNAWSPACTWLTSSYLLFGEIIPIGFTFYYHLFTGPQIKKGDEEVVEERRCEFNDATLSRKTTQMASPDSYVDEEGQRTTAMGDR